MNQDQESPITPHHSPLILRLIIIIYLLLFLCALAATCYLFSQSIGHPPLIFIDVLKYLLLSIIFAVLIVNGLKALVLKTEHLISFESSVQNFKWLFSIALLIAIIAKAGLFDSGGNKIVMISNLHLTFLFAGVLFSSWSSRILEKEVSRIDLIN